MSDDLRDLYASLDGLALADLVHRREVSAVEVLDTAVAAIESVNPELNAVIDRTYDYGRGQIAAGLPAGPFEGVPFLLKELATLVAGLKQTNACPYLRDYVATVDMETVVRQKRAGFVIVGKTNAPENGWSLTTEPAMFGPTRNPWRSDVTPGGSSGGAGAAVAARLVPIAEASDAAGSIRVPASNNGLVGLKPSRGRMTVAPAYGDVFFGCAHFLCVSRTVRDTAAYLDAIGGTVPGDPYTAPLPERPFLQEVTTQPDRLRIGFTRAAPDGQQLHPDALAAVEGAASLLEELGHDVEEHDLVFDFNAMWSTYMDVIAVQTDFAFEASATYVGRPVTPDEVSAITWEMIERGRTIAGTAHTRDVDSLRLFGREIAANLAPYDVFVTATMPQPPRPLGYWDMSKPGLDAYDASMGADGIYMSPFNISGQPAMSLPLLWTHDGLPLGVQIVGRPADEATLFRLAAQLESARPWIGHKPPVCT